MMHPNTEIKFISESIGYGVIATKRIPKGTITWVQDELDQVYTPAQVAQMKPLSQEMIDKYTFRNSQGNFVLCWDISKYVNHSFKSNCISTAYDFEIAIRDIEVGEELTDDYGYLNVTEAFDAEDEGTARTRVLPDDLLHYHKDWDALLEAAFRQLTTVQQPMMKWLSQSLQERVARISKGEEPMKSIKTLYCQEA
ncbi:MAG: SET domain-containing protein-lysine N-methyltransferase [Flavobacteriaceae bacterium]|nr:SET domain-containing protein-lysine N-methyltransferase [Flavobacteriaceae bacterium]